MSSLSTSVLDYHKPSNWDNMSYASSGGVACVVLAKTSAEYTAVRAKMRSTLAAEPSRIVRVQNPYLYGQYLLQKENAEKRRGSVLEKELWHVTSVANAGNIVKVNFDWRRTVRNKFGQGVSFSPDASYANTQANMNIGLSRALILTKVIVGGTSSGSSHTQLPAGNCDTTTGNNNKVYVKYYDNEFYPAYIAYYASQPYRKPHQSYTNHYNDYFDDLYDLDDF